MLNDYREELTIRMLAEAASSRLGVRLPIFGGAFVDIYSIVRVVADELAERGFLVVEVSDE